MKFLIKTDFKSITKDPILASLTENDTKTEIAEAQAIGQLTEYIGARYDINNVLNKTGDDRNQFLVLLIMDLVIYHLYTALSPNQIPAHRSSRYEDAIQWLKDVGRGTISSTLPTLKSSTDNQSSDTIKINGYPKQQHKF